MVYNLKYGNLICSKDGSLANVQDTFDRYGIIDYYFILPEAGELYYNGEKYEVTEPSVLFKGYSVGDGKAPEIFIIPCAATIARMMELKTIREANRNEKECNGCCPKVEN